MKLVLYLSSTFERAALVGFAFLLTLSFVVVDALPISSGVSEIGSFSLPRSPSGLFFDEDASSLLYVLCGTQTNGEHYLYVYNTDGEEQCLLTIPEASGMSRVDGFYITHDTGMAYIVDSQGPMWIDLSADRLGGSVYQVEWNDPCGCDSGSCTSTSVTWAPTVTQQWSLSAMDVSPEEGGGTDEFFRNSGIVVAGGSFYGVNGVHPLDGSLTGAYSKSIVKVDMASSEIIEHWPFDGSTVGRDIDMEGLTCGPDQCASSLFAGDEYNYIYELDMDSGMVMNEWDLTGIVNVAVDDKGIEALTYASTTGYFYAGIQDTSMVHVVELTYDEAVPVEEEIKVAPQGPPTTLSDCAEPSEDYHICTAPTIPLEEKRVRREIRSLSTEEWNKVVDAMWLMKTTDMDAGKAAYGDAFKTHDYFVVKHAIAATDTRGDQGHFGAHFITWHAAFVLEFENALLSIDPSIGAMPYWDECRTEPSLFTPDYFGTDPVGAPYEVTDGKFANWPILDGFSIDSWTPMIMNSSTVVYNGGGNTSTFLRGEDNLASSPVVTRYGSGSGFESAVPATCVADFWECTADPLYEWNEWFECIEIYFHSGPHASIGGRLGGGGGGGGPPPARSLQGPPGGGPPGGGGPQERGDFEDPVTSPNGAIFMFFHANLDRSRLWWMLRHNQQEGVCGYYSFPVENADLVGNRFEAGGNNFDGAHLNDVLSSAWGFLHTDLGVDVFDSDSSRTLGQATNADVLCRLNPETSPYTYDTHFDCLSDSELCDDTQRVAAPSSEGSEGGEESEPVLEEGSESEGEGASESEEVNGEEGESLASSGATIFVSSVAASLVVLVARAL